MRKISLFTFLMAVIAMLNLSSCTQSAESSYTSGVVSEVGMGSNDERLEQEKAEQQSLVGTFEIDDGHLGPIVLTVNDDGTATIKYKDSETIYYGSWYKYDNMEYAQFHFDGEQIYINRPKAVPQLYIGGTSVFLRDFVLLDGYLYASSNAAKAKNPNGRLKFKRVS